MLQEALAVVGLSASAFWAMSWDEYEYTKEAHFRQQQQQMAGFRLVAWQMVSMLVEKPPGLLEYLPLPLIDPPAMAAPKEAPQDTWNRLKAQGLL